MVRPLFLGLAAGLASAYNQDASALVQLHLGDMEELEELWSERSFMPAAAQFYAFDQYTEGEMAEGRSKDGSWLPVFIRNRGNGNSWNIHVSDTFPGYDLPNVPSNLIRKKLQRAQADFYIDNTQLQHKGLGVKYRYSKNMHDTGADFAPWGSLVVGTDEGDGWLKVSRGYLPMEVHGHTILARKERKGYVAAMPREFTKAMEEAKKQAEEAAFALSQSQEKAKELVDAAQYEIGEHCDLKTRHGDWYHARISEKTTKPGVYNVIVQVDQFSVYPVKNVPATRLKKVGPQPRDIEAGESPMCQKEGCIEVRLKPEDGEEILLHVAKKMGTEMLMKMACNRMKVAWGDCLTRATFTHKGEPLSASAHVADVDLEDQSVVQVSLAAPVSRAVLDDA